MQFVFVVVFLIGISWFRTLYITSSSPYTTILSKASYIHQLYISGFIVKVTMRMLSWGGHGLLIKYINKAEVKPTLCEESVLP